MLRLAFCRRKPRWTRLSFDRADRLKSGCYLALACAQDLFVALEMGLVSIGLLALAGRQVSLGVGLVAVLSAGFHLYLLIDFVVLTHLLFRLRRHFASHILHWSNYAKSAEQLGWKPVHVIALVVGLGVVSAGAVVWARRQFGPPTVGAVFWAAMLGALGLALASLRIVPRKAAFRLNNILFVEQGEWLRDLWQRFRRHEEVALVLSEWAPYERFIRRDEGKPLLRRAEAFTGEPQFELTLADGERPHVLLLFLESFRAANVGVIGHDVAASPEFDRLAREGALFTQFYCNGVQTTRAATASLFGILPRFTFAPEASDIGHLPKLRGLPQLFAELGYRSAYLHNGDLSYENQDLFYSHTGYDELHGIGEIETAFPKAQNLSGWGVPDEFLMRYYVDWLRGQDRRQRRTFATMFTISNHHPYAVPENFAAPAFACPGNDYKEKFLRAFYYTDHCLGLLVRLLKERGLYEKTVLFVLGDTGQPLGEHEENFSQQMFLYEENIHIPLLILAPGRLRQPAVIAEPASQVDLLPTFIDLFGQPFWHHSFGSSLVRRQPGRKVFFNNPYACRTFGLRRGPWKYLYEYNSDEAFLFDLAAHPGETENLVQAHPDQAAAMHAEVDQVTRLFDYLYRAKRFC